MGVQPYIIAIGPTLQDIVNYVIVIDVIRYEFTSPLMAFKVWFEIFHICNGAYPPASKHILYVIQRNLFKITTRYDYYGADVCRMLKRLEAKETEDKN